MSVVSESMHPKAFLQELSLNIFGTMDHLRWGHAPQQKGRSYQQLGSKPTNRTEVRKFIGLVNYMWKKRPEILAPLSELMSTKKTLKRSDKQQHALDTMKKIMTRETSLAYPNFEIPDASVYQLGAVISQNGKQ
jgi:hypothetical protein